MGITHANISTPGRYGRSRYDCLHLRDRRELTRDSRADLQKLEWAGLKIDAATNQQTVGREGLISTDDSKLLAYAIPTDEELLIARETVRVILGQPHSS